MICICICFCITFNFWNYLITASLFVRGAKFKRAPFVFEGGHIVIIRGNLTTEKKGQWTQYLSTYELNLRRPWVKKTKENILSGTAAPVFLALIFNVLNSSKKLNLVPLIQGFTSFSYIVGVTDAWNNSARFTWKFSGLILFEKESWVVT